LADQLAKAAVRHADIVVSLTNSREPFIEPGWLVPGAVLMSMGGCPEVACEVVDEIDRLIVDDLDYALAQGDFHAWIEAGRIVSLVDRNVNLALRLVNYSGQSRGIMPPLPAGAVGRTDFRRR